MLRLPALLLVLFLAACGTQPATPGGPVAAPAAAPALGANEPTDPTDPYEATNRRVLDFNLRVDDAVLRPVAVFYRDNVGAWTRTRIRTFLNNIEEPVSAANSLLQGRPLEAGQTSLRFIFNSIGGLGGFFDLAQFGGPPKVARDLGQTLAVWGVPDGPYLMVPVLGPSNPRELVGQIGGGFMNPISYFLPFAANIGRGAVQGVDTREQNIETVDELRATSLDFYARLRSLWQQNRDAELGRTAPAGGNPAVLDDPG